MKYTKLPRTVLNLDEIGLALTIQGARMIASVTTHHFGTYTDQKTGKTPKHKQHVIDFNGWKSADKIGETTIVHRSPYILNAKRHRSAYRSSVRKLAEFLDETKNVIV